MERRVAVIRSNRVDGPALACTVAVPFGGTLELSCRSLQLLKRILDFHIDAVVPKSSSYSIVTAKGCTVVEVVLGGMRLPRYVLGCRGIGGGPINAGDTAAHRTDIAAELTPVVYRMLESQGDEIYSR